MDCHTHLNLEMEEITGYYDDFVTNFLFGELQGYCVHFATSFVLLARLNGIPTRYTTGFLVQHEDERKFTIVTGLDAHAWPEVWTPESGWTAWEATPSLLPTIAPGSEEEWLLNLLNDINSGEISETVSSEASEQISTGEGQEIGVGVALLGVLKWFLPSLFALFLLIFIGYQVYSSALLETGKKQKLLFITKRIVSILAAVGIKEPRTMGWIQWSGRIQGAYPTAGKYARRVAWIINSIYFGNRTTGARDLIYLKFFSRRMRGMLRAKGIRFPSLTYLVRKSRGYLKVIVTANGTQKI